MFFECGPKLTCLKLKEKTCTLEALTKFLFGGGGNETSIILNS